MNRLVPYLDLFSRLDDRELGRLAGVESEVAAALRRQVDEVQRSLATYADLLPRLSDTELVRLTGASPKTIRFWRLCQPRKDAEPHDSDSDAVVGPARDARTVPVPSSQMREMAQSDAPSRDASHEAEWGGPQFEGLDARLEHTRVGSFDDQEVAQAAREGARPRRHETGRYNDPLALSGQPFPGFENPSFPPPGASESGES